MKNRTQRTGPDNPELRLEIPEMDGPEQIAEKERRLRALLESAEKINRDHPSIPVNKAMLLLNPLPRKSYTLEETAQILGISYKSVYRLVQKRKIRVLEVLRHKIVPSSEIDRLLNDLPEAA